MSGKAMHPAGRAKHRDQPPSEAAARLYNAGLQLQAQGRLPEAADAFARAAKQAPRFFGAPRSLAFVLMQAGRLDNALRAFEMALKLRPDDTECLIGIAQILRRARPQGYQPTLERRLLTLFASDVVKHQDLALVAALLLKQKHPLPEGDAPPPKALLTDPLLHRLLERAVLVDREFELLLTRLRHDLLLAPSALRLPRPLRYALARQCLNNAYVFHVTPEESAAHAALGASLAGELEGTPRATPELEERLLLFSLYAPLDSLPQAARLAELPLGAWSAAFRPILRQGLLERLEERELAEACPVLALSPDAVSGRVREQYEESPYPRWLHLDRLPPASLGLFLQQRLPGFRAPARLLGRPRILIAGCGTGRQAVALALCHREAEILAVDLSRASLAYGQRMAERFETTNLRFAQADILALDGIEERFDAIISTGVLHHMDDPLAGWRRLVGLLEPEGVMQIALYSTLARQAIAEARERIAALTLDDTPDGIRAYRQRVLTGEEGDFLDGLLEQPDFFDLNGCRDMLFHRQEHGFDPGRIAQALEELGLGFLGFDFSEPDLPLAYRKRFPGDPQMRDLANWAELEREQPDSFVAMYNFWCGKPAEG